MATIYFSANKTVYTANNDWGDISQWYSSPGSPGGKGVAATPGTLLGRLPTNSDTVIMYQDACANVGTNTGGGYIVGTFGGNIGQGYGAAYDANATWTGNTSFTTYGAGTFTKPIFSNPSTGLITVSGGTFTNTSGFTGRSTNLQFANTIFTYNGNVTTCTNPIFNFNAPISAYQITINNNSTYTRPFNCLWLIIDGQPGNGSPNYVKTYNPVITWDISTPNSSIQLFMLYNGKFANTNPIYFGNTSAPILPTTSLRTDFTQDIVIYSIGYGLALMGSTFTGKISFAPGSRTGTAAISNGAPYYGATGISYYKPTATIPLTKNSQGNFTLDTTKWPYDVGFASLFNASAYSPSVNVTNVPVITTNLGAITI